VSGVGQTADENTGTARTDRTGISDTAGLGLTIPPTKDVTPLTKTPTRLAAIVPPAPLAMPPANDAVAATSMPVLPEMLPLLVMPPANAVTAETSTPLPVAEMMPALLIPPPSVVALMTAIAVPLLASILL